MLRDVRASGRAFVTIALVHADLPFMYNRAIIEPGYFDVIAQPELRHNAVPRIGRKRDLDWASLRKGAVARTLCETQALPRHGDNDASW